MKIYHYTTFDKFLGYILPTKKLKFGSFAATNDLRENTISNTFGADLGEVAGLVHRESTALANEKRKYRFISFCKDKGRIKGWGVESMWTHYADKHKGICIEIDADKLKYRENMYRGNIIYNSKMERCFTNQDSAESYVKNCRKELFFTKTESWRYEQEYRIIIRAKNEAEFLDISNAITTVYYSEGMIEFKRKILYLLCQKTQEVGYFITGEFKKNPSLRLDDSMIDIAEYKKRRKDLKAMIPRFDEIFKV